MPAANMDRKHAKRELSRAVNLTTWILQHLQVVYDGFYAAAMAYAEMEQDIPDSYAQSMTQIQEIQSATLLIAEAIKGLDETL